MTAAAPPRGRTYITGPIADSAWIVFSPLLALALLLALWNGSGYSDRTVYAVDPDLRLNIMPLEPDFAATEYSSSSRRFVLGAVTHYAGPDVFAYEIAPYDTANPDMIADAYARIAASAGWQR